jgi:uncharacterized membrane protein YjjP (DUF1212 family)
VSRQQFVLDLGRAMHALGSPAYRVEDTMVACSRAMGLDGSFFATPTAIFAAIGEPGEEAKTTLLRVVPGDHDLGRLAALYRIRDRVVLGGLAAERGVAEVRAVLNVPSRVRVWRDVLAHGLVGAGAAVLLGGGGREVAVAGGAGLLSGGFVALSSLRPALGDVQGALTCAAVAFVARLASAWLPGLHVPVVTLAAIVVLLPGLSFTTALAELAMRHLAAGSARLLGTLAVLLTMTIGVGIGDRCAAMIVGATAAPEPLARLGIVWITAALAATWLAFAVLLRATGKQSVLVLLAVAAGFGGARLGSAVLGDQLGAVVGALVVTMLGNLIARLLRQPAAIVRTPGLLLLVPGSLGFTGLTTALSGDFDASAPLAFRMLLTGGAIVAGMLFAGVVVPPPLDVPPMRRVGEK